MDLLLPENEKQDEIKHLYNNAIESQSNYSLPPGYVLDGVVRIYSVHFLIKAAEHFNLEHDVVLTALNLFYRYLSAVNIRNDLDASDHAMITALWIAVKFKKGHISLDIFRQIPMIRDTVETYGTWSSSREKLIRSEATLVEKLNGYICPPTEFHYIELFAASVGGSYDFIQYCRYICILSLLDVTLTRIPAADKACACFVLARHCFYYNDIWPRSIQYITQKNLNELRLIILNLNQKLMDKDNDAYVFLNKIYSSDKYGYASLRDYHGFHAVQ